MINIRVENISDEKTEVEAKFDIKGKRNMLDEFTAVLESLERADRAIFACALLTFFDSKKMVEDNDKE